MPNPVLRWLSRYNPERSPRVRRLVASAATHRELSAAAAWLHRPRRLPARLTPTAAPTAPILTDLALDLLLA